MGYSYDLTWGARSIFSFDPGAVPGVRLQYQNGGNYAFLGAKTAVGDYITPDTREPRNQTYYGVLAGAGFVPNENLKFEGGWALFQQDQIKNVQNTNNPLYGEIINAMGYSGQISTKRVVTCDFFQSADLRLYKNDPDAKPRKYIRHRQLDGFGAIFQSEINVLQHNLLDPKIQNPQSLKQELLVTSKVKWYTTPQEIAIDLVYKDLSYILFNVPGLTSGVAMSPDMETSAQYYGRFTISQYMPDRHFTPSLGIGWMRPATYKTEGGTFVQYTAYDKEQVPEGQAPTPILSSILEHKSMFQRQQLLLENFIPSITTSLTSSKKKVLWLVLVSLHLQTKDRPSDLTSL